VLPLLVFLGTHFGKPASSPVAVDEEDEMDVEEENVSLLGRDAAITTVRSENSIWYWRNGSIAICFVLLTAVR